MDRRRLILAGGSRWTPRNLGPSLLLGWWTADRSDLITRSGSQVTSWKDVVAGYDVVQAVSGARPLYSATSFNGAPGITFDGIDDELTLGSAPFPSGSNGGEIWALVNQASLVADTGVKYIASYGTGGANNARGLSRAVVTGVNRASAEAGNGSAVVSAVDASVDFSGRHVLRGVFSATAAAISVDGGSSTSAAVIPSTGTTRVRFGARTSTTPTNYFGGAMRDILFLAPNAPASQIAKLTTYLMNKRMP